MTLLVMHATECFLDQMDQLICSALNGLVQSVCLISDRNGLTTFEADIHHTAHIVIAALLVTVLIAQVDIYPCDVIAEIGSKHFPLLH